MKDILIPTLLFWENGNTFYGSKGLARFFISPIQNQSAQQPTQTPQETTLSVEVWRGPNTKSLSQVLATASFPLSEDGLSQATLWLEEQAVQLNQD